MDLSKIGLKSQTDLINDQNVIKNDPKTGNWTGKVVDIADPLMLGRIKIDIFGYYDGYNTDSLPWSIPSNSFLGAKNSNFIVPELNSIVTGYFDNNDEMKPIYEGIIRTKETDLASTTLFERTLDYQNTQVLYENDYGDALIVNKKEGTYKFKHRTGLLITIGNSGKLELTTNLADFGMTINGDVNMQVTGKTDIVSQGDVNVDGKSVNLGKNLQKQLVNNLPACLICGSPHQIGNTNVKA
jgi:hypothetical protein